MKFFENMDPIEREIMILKAVLGSVSLEGMKRAAEECESEIAKLEAKRHFKSTLKPKGQTG
ncbi:hypothetical protein [Desulfatibacillum aliphaticivorans]|uniref:Uncharacterized protein n=1 Tax=Desulfatibacillum aliphaticivorans TaxID=218208 RepID=B8FM31_DESAL|nr:hypothetical protein [Desulfatibacillum aliphaticivorans]ACL05764.1 hypothetical protein Dalk_4079 [Desulfatibacillum aliphaticivorans]